MAILVALIGKNTAFKGEAVPFVMELPNYRRPGLKNVLRLISGLPHCFTAAGRTL